MQGAFIPRNIMFSYVVCMAVPYFPHYVIKGTIFGTKNCWT